MTKTILILTLFLFQFLHANDQANKNTLLFLGDSLTEGLGVNKGDAYPKLVETLLQKEINKNITVINGGVSGSTTSDALTRLQWYMKKKPSLVFIALGANDGLRGLDLQESQKNLEEIIEYAQNSGAKVLLSGMLIPPNYGPAYSDEFKTMYKNLSKKYKLQTMPFLLDGVAGVKELNQRDGIHPNEKGHQHIAHNVFEFIEENL